MSKFTFNFAITPGTAVEYALSVPPFHATLRETTLALTTTTAAADERKLREQADEVAHNLARSLSYEHSQRFDVAYGSYNVLRPTGQQSVTGTIHITVKP